jgi:hypothetical protein
MNPYWSLLLLSLLSSEARGESPPPDPLKQAMMAIIGTASQPCTEVVELTKLPLDDRFQYIRVLCRASQDSDKTIEYTLRYADENFDVYRK